MNDPSSTSYDTVPYVSTARTSTSPVRMEATGRLLGLAAAGANAARVLEVGCGDGGNVIPMALALPGSAFLGIDLAPTAIAKARAAAAAAGVSNARFEMADLAALPGEFGGFDYVIAHGVYSWVPAPVRAALLELVRERMAPAGIAFVSYNALPGGHFRGALRTMMRRHTAAIADPAEKIRQARALLAMLQLAPDAAGEGYRSLLQSEIGVAARSSDHLLYHDDLAEVNEAFYFADFVAEAAAHGLAFLAEANFADMSLDALPEPLARTLGALGERDLIAREQYLDYVRCRGFRQTLLCHAEAPIDRAISLERMRPFRVAGLLSRAEVAAGVEYRSAAGAVLATGDPATIAALDRVAAAHPASVPFSELATGMDEATAETLAEAVYRAFAAGVVGLRLFEPAVATRVSERPRASARARLLAGSGRVVNLLHEGVAVDGDAARVLAALDGTRTLAEVARALGMTLDAVLAEAEDLARHGLLTA
ncbi:MAG: methyltransferase regulatory domain-containing protein [Dehalococcoidia bacterium]|nr:methyltransferase regulatory domain-containing protein [Dehalococcoidia bacterium]